MASCLPHHVPEEFALMFVQLGRSGCAVHFKVKRPRIDAWMRQIGKKDLIERRAEHVRAITQNRGETHSRPIRACPPDFAHDYVQLGQKECERRYCAGWRTIHRWKEECGRERLEEARARYQGKRLNAGDIGQMLSRVYPVERANLRGDAGSGAE